MRLTLFTRIFSGFLLILAVFAVVALWITFGTIQRRYEGLVEKHLESMARAASAGLVGGAWRAEPSQMQADVTELGQATGVRLTIVDTNGVVLADSHADPATMENHARRPEVSVALGGERGVVTRFSETLREYMHYVALPVKREGRVVAVVRASAPRYSIGRLVGLARRELLVIFTLLVLVAGVAAAVLAQRLAHPVRELSRAARRITEGQFDVFLDLPGTRELEELSAAFNQMTRRVRDVVDQLSSRNAELDAVISAMREALVVIDEEDRILLANASFARLSLVPPSRRTHVWECVRVPTLVDMVQATRATGVRQCGDVQIGDQHFLCNVNPLNGSREIVVTLHDVTELKRVERMRRDFVSNVSHELRTPLTAIKGFVETLEEEAALRHNRYLEIIRRHTDRLIAIVEDLLTLSALEQRNDLQREATDVRALVNSVVKMFEPQLREKHLTCTIEAEPDLPAVLVDPFRFNQVVVNLVDNAIKYTEQGGITIRLARVGENLRMSVQDTGIGIPPEHLPRIFERFYTVDKSRARRHGGTGLGLSIVKHIIGLHGGTVSVTSEVNEGTTFTVEVPIHPPGAAARSEAV
ncbi:MAG: ATP-binding protein [bacterium]|nr:ATP-binding protein [bacterium]